HLLLEFLRAGPGRPGRGIPFDAMFRMKEYPEDVLPLYAQGHSLSVFLMGQRGKRAFLEFLGDGMTDENWRRAVQQHYGYEHLLALQTAWLDWVKAGRPAIAPSDGALLADGPAAAPSVSPVSANVTAGTPPVFRGQSPDPSPPRASSPTTTGAAVDASTADWSTRPVHAAAPQVQMARDPGVSGRR
ncbi:MAG TPA: hypothetical protein PJ982_12110, partial [Lacipirellulaceae bacterium]|nr:hypothetical protein [Lacipirellulaceae bacterium]